MGKKRVNITNIPQGDSDPVQQPENSAQEQLDKLEKTVQVTNRILFQIRTIFPFEIFPDDIIIDSNKVNIIRRDFLHEKIHSVYIKDITDVLANIGIITGTLEIIDQGFTENSIRIRHLKKSETIRARRIIQGLIVVQKNGIDLNQITDIEQMLEKIEKIGETKRT